MNRRFVRFLKASSVILSLFVMAGCVPLLVGAAAGAGGYAWYKGALVKQFDHPTTDVHRATVAGLRDLNLPVLQDRHDRVSARIVSRFSDGEDIHIGIDAKTEKTCEIKIRIGVFGSKVRSAMIYNALQKHL